MGNNNRDVHLADSDPEVFTAIYQETTRQHENLELIASENFVSAAVLEAQGSVLTNKYAEGYPNQRWYQGCKFVDAIEDIARRRARELFGADHANVQPYSGSIANTALYLAVLKSGDTILSMDFSCGGHLTHGYSLNFSGKFFKTVHYGVKEEDERIDYEQVEELARVHRPRLIVVGASAYPRIIDFVRFRQIADLVGAYVMADIAHIGGLIAAGVHPTPVPCAEFVTGTTHKTLRGSRGGFILCRKEFARKIDGAVFPGIQGGPLVHAIAAKAVTFREASTVEFKEYQAQIVRNARSLAEELVRRGYRLVTGGTDNHLLLIDLRSKNISGAEAARALDLARITANKNLIPHDPAGALDTSGLRLGTPAVTTRGMKESQMRLIAGLIDEVLSSPEDEAVRRKVAQKVEALIREFPLYSALRQRLREKLNLPARGRT